MLQFVFNNITMDLEIYLRIVYMNFVLGLLTLPIVQGWCLITWGGGGAFALPSLTNIITEKKTILCTGLQSYFDFQATFPILKIDLHLK